MKKKTRSKKPEFPPYNYRIGDGFDDQLNDMCPFCGSENIDSLDESFNGDDIEQYWNCGACEAAWKRIFTYSKSQLQRIPKNGKYK